MSCSPPSAKQRGAASSRPGSWSSTAPASSAPKTSAHQTARARRSRSPPRALSSRRQNATGRPIPGAAGAFASVLSGSSSSLASPPTGAQAASAFDVPDFFDAGFGLFEDGARQFFVVLVFDERATAVRFRVDHPEEVVLDRRGDFLGFFFSQAERLEEEPVLAQREVIRDT